MYADAGVCGRASSGITASRCVLYVSPISVQTSLYQSLGCRIDLLDMTVRNQAQQDEPYLSVFVRALTKLGIGE